MSALPTIHSVASHASCTPRSIIVLASLVLGDHQHGAARRRPPDGSLGGHQHANHAQTDTRCAAHSLHCAPLPAYLRARFWWRGKERAVRASLSTEHADRHRGLVPPQLPASQTAHPLCCSDALTPCTQGLAPAHQRRTSAMAAERSRRTPLPFYGAFLHQPPQPASPAYACSGGDVQHFTSESRICSAARVVKLARGPKHKCSVLPRVLQCALQRRRRSGRQIRTGTVTGATAPRAAAVRRGPRDGPAQVRFCICGIEVPLPNS